MEAVIFFYYKYSFLYLALHKIKIKHYKHKCLFAEVNLNVIFLQKDYEGCS